ncbi:alcohol dehydrogenase catalytic domain-containing protein [Streptomyces luomodiensis]|uniref:2-deoxy-scyllo-inosamine dehydrogenase n=1 Tax=Streptomyces luomodiensis TaxID=3026192 RepID=A0ABY9V8R9_9ACTN|nr:alcohol dehydrogenase catalytic domain-containing protein [Streptomyces sp. SCA4-21]WNF00054.1 alcohol dehydrogenase catalytic domain-containing protein [Streptomyces sp. SCA4-21]
MSERFEGIAYTLTSAGEVVVRQRSVPADRTVLRVAAAGVCGTDLIDFRGRLDRPGTLPDTSPGHEIAGTVVHSEDGWPVGTPVVVDPAFHCGACGPCAAGRTSYCERLLLLGHTYGSGGLARYVAVPGTALLRMPDRIDVVSAALVEPLACAHHAAAKVTCDGPALVLGAGTIGLGVALLLRARGLEVAVADPAPVRAALAADLGLPVGRPDGALPVVVEASGTAAGFHDALDAVARGGHVLVAAQHSGTLTVDAGLAFGKELRLSWSLGALRADFHAVLRLLAAGVLDPRPLATPVRPEDFGTATFRDMAAGHTAKPVVVWDAQL